MDNLKGLICYHSNTGNTAATVTFVQRRLSSLNGVMFDVHDVSSGLTSDWEAYDVVGLATWTYYLGVPPLLARWLAALPDLADKPVFLLTTYGVMPGWALKRMAEAVMPKGAVVIGAHAFHTPESYPPFIVKGWDSADAPDAGDLAKMAIFLADLEQQCERIKRGQAPDTVKVKLGLFDYVIRPYSVEKARRKMGALAVDSSVCTGCGTCERMCRYGAITFEEGPQFDAAACQGCFACFNHCPTGAIFTEKLKGVGQYAGPGETFLAKLGQ